jgi:hypothetical protein
MEDEDVVEGITDQGPPPDVAQADPNWKDKWLTAPEQPPKPPKENPLLMPLEGEDQKRWIRRLWLVQGWTYKRIASHMRVPYQCVRNYIIQAGLVEKKKDKSWTPDDLLLTEDVAQRALEKQMLAERVEIAAAKRKGEAAAITVVKEVMSREKIAKEALLKITEQASDLGSRIKQAIEHMETDQNSLGMTNARDLKDLTAAYLNLVRAGRELSGERGAGDKTPSKHPPIRIGVMGTVRISGGDVSVHDNGMAVDV